MESVKLFTKIKELGHVNSKRDELQELCRLKFDQILKYLPRRILDSDGGDVLDCLLNGLPDNPTASSKQAAKFIDIVLQSMRKESTSLTHCGDVISRLCLELSRQSAEDLVRWSNDSIQSIIRDSDVNMIWRDVIPECLNALSSYSEVKHCETTITSEEFKERCVHTLCQCQWSEKQLVQLAGMFKDMQLARNEHKQVVSKMCSYIIDISPDVLPPLLHHLLKLCKLYHVEIVLGHLSHYFSVRLYSKLEPPPQDSESTTMDIDDIAPHSQAELSRCLSTCIYHITEGAAEPEVIRKHLKVWPKTQLLRGPFLLDVLLALSNKGSDFKSVCLDVIRSAIELRLMDDLRSKESAWVRSVLPPDVDVANVLKVLTTESANHRQLTVLGLINLSFALLSAGVSKANAHTCWSLGKLIAVRLCKAQPETAPHVLGLLADRLAGDTAPKQYADCLFVLCKLTPVSVERCTQLSTILENCRPSGTEYRTSAAVLDAVHPLLNFSTRTRDTMVMVCRKGLYSREPLHRCLALSGFLTVLRHVKLSRSTLGSSSQSACSDQYSAYSYLTQAAVDLHATQQGNALTSRVRNEAMCMEVVSILRRCLVQDATVKQLLYTKLYDCVRDKAALHESVLELLYEHLTKYLPDSTSVSILFNKCVQINATSATLTEPIAHLLYAVTQFLQCEEEDLEDILSSQDADTSSAHLKSKLTNILEKLCDDLGQVDMEEQSLADITPEAKAKCLTIQQVLQCYEALVAYRVMQWRADSRGVATFTYDLYKKCFHILEQTKTPAKTGKKNNKTLNETRETVKSQKSQKSQKDKKKAPMKLSSLTKDRAGPFKPLPCVWDLRFCHRIVVLLYSEEVPWSSLEQRNELRARRDFHQWVLRCVTSVLQNEHIDKKSVAFYVPKIAFIVYQRCLCRFQHMCDFDDQTMLQCTEVFKACLTLLLSPNYSLKIESVLPIITGVEDITASSGILDILEQLHTALVQVEADSDVEERDTMLKKHLIALIQTAALLLDTPVPVCPKMNGVIVKFEDHLRTSKTECLALVPSVLTASTRAQQEATLLSDIIAKLGTALGNIDEEDTSAAEETDQFPTIDARTGHSVLNHVCLHLYNRFKHTEHLLARARDLTVAQNYAVHGNQQRIDRELKELYKSLVIQLCQLSTWTSKVCKLRCCIGGGSDRVLTVGVRLYSLLAAFFKQTPVAMAATLRLERLLKLCGKKLSSVSDTLVTYLEASQQPRRVLRDTKLIPRLVLEAENFTKHAILLANGAKLNFQHYLSLGTARDFRIRAPLLQEALQAREQPQEDTDATRDEGDVDINDAETEIISPASSVDENMDVDEEEANAKKKRRRVS